MDAIIMDGNGHRMGAVGCITNVRNPIKVARMVMDKVVTLLTQ
jgi:isoaspartyl peptidase/L-asparaginase-like protein (Ntn-hydrolase superfamily)